MACAGFTIQEMGCHVAYGDRKSERIEFERGIDVYIMGIDGTWRRDGKLNDVCPDHSRHAALKGVDQRQGKDEEAGSPEHKSKAGVRCRRFLDANRERDHVWPERNCQRAERRRENDDHHGERHLVLTVKNAGGHVRFEARW